MTGGSSEVAAENGRGNDVNSTAEQVAVSGRSIRVAV